MNISILKKNLLPIVLVSFLIGTILGFTAPNFAIHLQFLGDIFINSIKMLIVPLIFCSIFLGVLDNEQKKLGRLLSLSILCFLTLFVTTFVISLPIAKLINPGANFNFELLNGAQAISADPVTLQSIANNIVPTNIIAPFVESNILQVILITLIFSILLVPYKQELSSLINTISIFSKLTFKLLDLIMLFSPLAVLALIANTVAVYGSEALLSLGEYIFCAYILFAIIMILIVIVPIKVLTNKSLKEVLSALSKIWVLGLSTASSTACLPTTFKVVEQDFGISQDQSRFILPLSTTLNMIGGAVSFATLSIFALNISDITLTLPLFIEMTIIATVINMSAPGIPGGGIVLGTIYLSTLGLPVEIMALIAGIYRIVDIIYTTLNISADVVGAIIIDRLYKRPAKAKAPSPIKSAISTNN